MAVAGPRIPVGRIPRGEPAKLNPKFTFRNSIEIDNNLYALYKDGWSKVNEAGFQSGETITFDLTPDGKSLECLTTPDGRIAIGFTVSDDKNELQHYMLAVDTNSAGDLDNLVKCLGDGDAVIKAKLERKEPAFYGLKLKFKAGLSDEWRPLSDWPIQSLNINNMKIHYVFDDKEIILLKRYVDANKIECNVALIDGIKFTLQGPIQDYLVPGFEELPLPVPEKKAVNEKINIIFDKNMPRIEGKKMKLTAIEPCELNVDDNGKSRILRLVPYETISLNSSNLLTDPLRIGYNIGISYKISLEELRKNWGKLDLKELENLADEIELKKAQGAKSAAEELAEKDAAKKAAEEAAAKKEADELEAIRLAKQEAERSHYGEDPKLSHWVVECNFTAGLFLSLPDKFTKGTILEIDENEFKHPTVKTKVLSSLGKDEYQYRNISQSDLGKLRKLTLQECRNLLKKNKDETEAKAKKLQAEKDSLGKPCYQVKFSRQIGALLLNEGDILVSDDGSKLGIPRDDNDLKDRINVYKLTDLTKKTFLVDNESFDNLHLMSDKEKAKFWERTHLNSNPDGAAAADKPKLHTDLFRPGAAAAAKDTLKEDKILAGLTFESSYKSLSTKDIDVDQIYNIVVIKFMYSSDKTKFQEKFPDSQSPVEKDASLCAIFCNSPEKYNEIIEFLEKFPIFNDGTLNFRILSKGNVRDFTGTIIGHQCWDQGGIIVQNEVLGPDAAALYYGPSGPSAAAKP